MFVVVASLALGALPAAGAAPASNADLERQKLEQEVAKLKAENDAPLREIGGVAAVVGVLTAMVAVGGLLVAWRSQRAERERDRGQRKAAARAELEQRERERKQRAEAALASAEQRERERLQREEADFAALSSQLAAEQAGLRASGAAGMEAFLIPARAGYRDRLLRLLAGLLKVTPEDPTRDMMVRLLGRLLHAHSIALRQRREASELDLSWTYLRRADLDRAYLPNVRLTGADLRDARLRSAVLNGGAIAGANLAGARLEGAYLRQVTGFEGDAVEQRLDLTRAVLDGAHLTDGDLRWAHCENTSFRGAELQQLDLRHATLIDVHFAGANLSRARFEGARFGGSTLASVLAAADRSGARFDAAVESWLAGDAQAPPLESSA